MPKSININITLTCDYCGKVRENFPNERQQQSDCWSILKYFLDKGEEKEPNPVIICPWCRSKFEELFRIIRYVRDGGETVALSKENELPAKFEPPYEFTEADANAIYRRVSTPLLRIIIAKHPKLGLKNKSVEEEDKIIAEETGIRKVQYNKRREQWEKEQ